MISSIMNYLANQARKPSGWFGRLVAPRVFNHENKHMEDFGLELLEPQKDDNNLEIGFGHGRLISEMTPQIKNGKICGIDISEQMVDLAIKHNKKWIRNGKLEIEQASIANIPFPDNHFDKVFTCNTIYFWPDSLQNIREVKRVLEPKGKFCCTFRDKQLMESKSSAVTENREIFQNLYRPDEVIELFQEAGLKNVIHKNKNSNSEEIHVVIGKEIS